jgi:hypothetical protein
MLFAANLASCSECNLILIVFFSQANFSAKKLAATAVQLVRYSLTHAPR